MIRQYLEDHYNIGRLYSSYLINTDEMEQALEEVKSFIGDNILANGDLDRNPDYIYVQKVDNIAKNITVDQIRELQELLHKTSVISGQKIAVIYAADQMNLNAANSCLKILEEPPASTHLFLLTENAASLLPTIRSRCAKINYHYDVSKKYVVDERFIYPLLKSTSLSERLSFVEEFASKDRDLWISFSSSIEVLLAKFCRKKMDFVNLSALEQELLTQFKSDSLQYLQFKYDEVKEIIDNTNNFDLDLKASATLLMDKLRK